jgi:hypothetical protein
MVVLGLKLVTYASPIENERSVSCPRWVDGPRTRGESLRRSAGRVLLPGTS